MKSLMCYAAITMFPDPESRVRLMHHSIRLPLGIISQKIFLAGFFPFMISPGLFITILPTKLLCKPGGMLARGGILSSKILAKTNKFSIK